MNLIYYILIPAAGGLLAWRSDRIHPSLPGWISIFSMAVPLTILLPLWKDGGFPQILQGPWIAEVRYPWIPMWGVSIHLAMDGLSLVLLTLTFFLGMAAVAASWTGIRQRAGFFHMNLMAVITGIAGVFLSVDLFLFAFFWEVMLVPMYLLILLWGHENRRYAAMKFFLFTQAGGMLMIISIVGLVAAHARASGVYTFDYADLLAGGLDDRTSMLLMLGFLAAFAVKLPALPLHPWLADAHTEAPTAGSVVLAGLLLKTGAYGMIRFVVPLFPSAAHEVSTAVMAVGAAGIIYGAVMAFGQTDLKRLVAYSSVSHMGFVLLGIFAWNAVALKGAVMQMVCHGLATGGLFIIVGSLQERMHTRDMTKMGGLWASVPRVSALALFFGIASLGLPGLGNFVGEFLVLLGSFKRNMPATVIAAAGLVFAAVYALWMVQKTFHGEPAEGLKLRDLSLRETVILGVMAAAIVWLGLFPQRVLDVSGQGIRNAMQMSDASHSSAQARLNHAEVRAVGGRNVGR